MNNGKVRVYELSKELGLTNTEILAVCDRLDIAVKSHSSTISDEDAQLIRTASLSMIPVSSTPPPRPISPSRPAPPSRPKIKKRQILEIRRPAPTPPKLSKKPPLKELEFRIDYGSGKAKHFLEKLGDGVALDMVQIPAGSFLMGSPEDELERLDFEGPQHRVTVPSFFMGRYPVTQAQWRAVARMEPVNPEVELKLNPSNFEGDDRPVERVNWFEAQEFCARLSATTPGRVYRLPSEAEWEYACRAGTTTAFHFGESLTTDLANYRGTEWKEVNASGQYGRGPTGEYREETTPVGRFPANDFGLHDMHGNLWEWCEDEWHDRYDDAPDDGSAWVTAEGAEKQSETAENEPSRVLRGGSWFPYPSLCRSACRCYLSPGDRDGNYGFRLVCVSARTP